MASRSRWLLLNRSLFHALHARPFEPDQLWQLAREPIFWLDPTLRLIWVNRAWENLTGHPAESVVGLDLSGSRSDTRGRSGRSGRELPSAPRVVGRPARGNHRADLPCGGERIWHRLEFWPFRDEHDSLIGLLGLVRAADDPPSVPDSRGQPAPRRAARDQAAASGAIGFDSLVGFGPSHRRLLDQVRLAAASTTPVLIVGEPGTGKRQVARTIHQNGPGRSSRLVPFDCEALPAEILERELFGVGQRRRASRPVETSRRPAAGRPRLSLGEGSTLLIREILMLPRDLQARLAASLDSPSGCSATTALDPEIALESEQLRPELYFALTTLVVRFDRLRERRDELPVLAQHLLERANQRGGKQKTGFSPQALAASDGLRLAGKPARARSRHRPRSRSAGRPEPLVAVDDLPASIRGNLGGGLSSPAQPSPIKPLDELLTEVEQRLIETRLAPGPRKQVARRRLLGISRPRLYRRIKELNLPDDGDVEHEARPRRT